MKHNGAVMEYADERMRDLMRAYDEYISSCEYVRMPDVYAMMRGVPLKGMRPLKREMFEEIFRRVLALRKKRPELTVRACCCVVVAGPAPKFYLTPGSAKIMVCKARKKWIQEKLKRLRLL